MNVTAADVVEMLRDRYSDQDRYVFMPEVPERTGNLAGASIIDVAVLCLYKSDGYRLLAFEIKTSRKDWAAEVANPEKNKGWHGCASQFFYVAPASVVNEPIPGGWIEVLPGEGRGSSRLRLRRKAGVFSAGLEGPLVASLVRAARQAGAGDGRRGERRKRLREDLGRVARRAARPAG